MYRILTIFCLIAVAAALSLPAQEIFELPVELELPELPVALEVDGATVDIVLDPRSLPLLRAESGADKEVPGLALAVGSDGARILVRRAREDDPLPRLRLELVLAPELWVRVAGSDLDVAVEALPVEPEPEGEDDDEGDDDEGDDDEGDDEDDDEGDDDEGEGDEGGEGYDINRGPGAGGVAEVAAAADDHGLTFEVAASSLQLTGVQGAGVTAIDSYLHAAGTGGTLIADLQGVTAEIASHKGVLELTSRDGELTVSELEGRAVATLTGGSLLLGGSFGQLEAKVEDAVLRVDGWRGRLKVEGSASRIDARALEGARVELQGEGLEIGVEELRGTLQATLDGGTLTASEIAGGISITGRNGAEIAVDGHKGGALTLGLQGGSARLANLSGPLRTNVNGGRLELDGGRRLELDAQQAEIVVGRLKQLAKFQVKDSQVDLDLSEVQGSPTLTLDGTTEARVRLLTPCQVKLGEVELLGGRADVTGCDLHSHALRRSRYERGSLSGRRRVVLSATLGEDSTLEVEGVP